MKNDNEIGDMIVDLCTDSIGILLGSFGRLVAQRKLVKDAYERLVFNIIEF